MPKFAVYYIPQAEDSFYRLGSALLGYDVRERRTVVSPPGLSEALGPFDPAWTTISRPYGFHLSITEAITCEAAIIPRVAHELADLVGCFDPAHAFTLTQYAEQPIGIWGEAGRQSLVLLYRPDEYLRMLHTLLVARLHPLGQGSGFLDRYLTHPEQEGPPHRIQQTRLFYSPTVLDSWHPHFTLLNPYTGSESASMARRLALLFKQYTQLSVQTVCLLIQMDSAAHWHLYQEFHRPAPPAITPT